nr:glycoside hydrolase family 36 N-terminal domain-containing protein [Salinicoccus roseus]
MQTGVSVHGTTDYREPAFQLLQENVSRITNFEYNGHQIFREKSNLTDCRQHMWKMMMKRKVWKFLYTASSLMQSSSFCIRFMKNLM